MNRKIIICLLTTALLSTVPFVEAQQPGKVLRIVVTRPERSGDPEGQLLIDAFRQGLRELGYGEGKHFVLEVLWLEGEPARLPERIAEAVRRNANFIITSGTSSTRAAQKATSTIPIIMGNADDPVVTGLVPSLARPGGNITGLTNISTDLADKRLELLKEVVPRSSRMAVLLDPSRPRDAAVKQTEEAAHALGVRLQSLVVQGPDDFEGAFRSAVKGRAEALIIVTGGLFNRHRTRLVELANTHRLPAMYTELEYARAGGLMVYASSQTEQYRRAATYVHKILKGAKPAELPIELPTKFELVINLKTAKQIGLTIPPNVLARADKVIK
jgi:putative ABC transport system substrate-binding protein